jgi:ATP-dependent protease ClpP protease subunit
MGDAEPRRWFQMARAQASGTAVVRIFGDIGESWWAESVSAASFAKELDALGELSALEIRLNSPGGDMFDGVAIFNTLRTHSARKQVYVDGLAASAASIVAMAADELVMGTGTQLMIHDAWSVFAGNADDARKQADVLDQLSGSMAEIYADRAGGDPATWRDAMREETWYGAQEAVDAGLADRVSKRDPQNDGAHGEPADVAAMLRRSRVAARFRYQGRAQAPPPTIPARSGGARTRGGSVEITDEEFATLASRLGLGADAEIGDVLDALEEQSNAEETPEETGAVSPAPEAVAAAAKLPAGVLAVDTATWQQVQADAKLGREAREAQVKARREAVVDAAVKAKKVLPPRRAHWLQQIEADEEGVTATLASLSPQYGTTEIGYDDGPESGEASTVEAVRNDPVYKSWKVV